MAQTQSNMTSLRVSPPMGGAYNPRTATNAPANDTGTRTRSSGGGRRGVPFSDAEDCIIWAINTLAQTADEATNTGRPSPPICDPLEVVRCLDTLYRRRRIDLRHVRILRIWAHRGRAPRRTAFGERADWQLWREVIDRLEWPLRTIGIIS